MELAPRFAQIADDDGLQWDGEWGGGWWIAVILLGILFVIIVAANVAIVIIANKFKERLTERKSDMDNARGINADAPAMSPARVKKENVTIVEMTKDFRNDRRILIYYLNLIKK